jgi:hypothetical protein
MLQNRHFGFRLFPALACASLSVCAFAQIQRPTPQNPYPMPPMTVENGPPQPANVAPNPTPNAEPRPEYRRTPAPQPRPAPPAAKPSPAVPVAHTPPAPAKPVPYSILNTPAEPAKVTLASGKLTIEATNSSLSSILGQIAKAGGMKIVGPYPNAGQRVFGKYGPGAPREVLYDLLAGSGYNIMMLGVTPAGTPRELTLSARTGGVPRPAPHAAQTDEENNPENYEDSGPAENDDQGPQYSDQPQEVEEPEAPNASQIPPNGNRVRTPQQILQELQRMHQQQQPPQ